MWSKPMSELLSIERSQAFFRDAATHITDYLDDQITTEVMLNADGCVWVEQVGKGIFRTDIVMNPVEAETLIRLIATHCGGEISERYPSLAAKLPIWGARVQASVPPIVDAPIFAIRKPCATVFKLIEYVEAGTMTASQMQMLSDAIMQRQNILVGGGTGSGKTTLANALLAELASTSDRIYIVEDTPELRCEAQNKVQILVKPPVYTYHQAIVDALRYRPDRIVLGEVRDGAPLDLLKSWNTGHPGGIATVHANSAESMLTRIGQLIEERVPIAPRELINEAIDLCVHIKRDNNNQSGRSISIVEVE